MLDKASPSHGVLLVQMGACASVAPRGPGHMGDGAFETMASARMGNYDSKYQAAKL